MTTCVAVVHLILTDNDIPWTWVIVISGGALLALSIVLSIILAAVIYVIRRSKNKCSITIK